MKFTFEMQFVMDISESFMDSNEVDFNKGVLDGDIKIEDLEFKAVDPDGKPIEISGVENAELLNTFMSIMQDKSGAE